MQWAPPSLPLNDVEGTSTLIRAVAATAAVVPEKPCSQTAVLVGNVPLATKNTMLDEGAGREDGRGPAAPCPLPDHPPKGPVCVPSDSDSDPDPISAVETVSQIQRSQERARRLILAGQQEDMLVLQKSSLTAITLSDSQETVCSASELDFSFLRAASYDE